MISTASQLLFSVSAVRRMLGLPSTADIQIREFAWVVWVWVRGKRPTFISKKAFKAHFVEWRKGAARALTATADLFLSHSFIVRNSTKDSTYRVQLFSGGLLCECEDFKNQAQFFGRACCKHGYAVLTKLGLGSLSEYIERCSPTRRAA